MHTKASRLRKSRSPKVDRASGNRLPPGQVLTERFPILHEGAVPEYDTRDWSLRLFGTLDRPTAGTGRTVEQRVEPDLYRMDPENAERCAEQHGGRHRFWPS